MFYIFHGDDEFQRAEFVRSLKARMGDPAMADLNTITLNGRTTTLRDLTNACNAMPFASDRRLVIVDGLLTRLRSRKKGTKQQPAGHLKKFEQELLAYLERGLPPTARLLFLEPGKLGNKNPLTRSPILKLARSTYPNNIKSFDQPTGAALTQWIVQRVRQRGGNIDRAAATELAAYAGNDLRHVDQEIAKLVLYAGGERAIVVEDVRQLVSDARETSIFDLVDAVGRRKEDLALRLLHRLLDEGSAPTYLLAMITRQVRILLQIKTLLEQHLAQKDIAARIGQHPYVVQKGIGQAHNFTSVQLRRGFAQLFKVDLAIKTGRIDPIVGLDLLIVALSRDQETVLPVKR